MNDDDPALLEAARRELARDGAEMAELKRFSDKMDKQRRARLRMTLSLIGLVLGVVAAWDDGGSALFIGGFFGAALGNAIGLVLGLFI